MCPLVAVFNLQYFKLLNYIHMILLIIFIFKLLRYPDSLKIALYKGLSSQQNVTVNH